MLNNLEKGDIVVIRKEDGTTASVTVLSVKPDYEKPGAFVRFDYINYAEASPMRRTAWPKELIQILRKTANKPLDPKTPRKGDALPPGHKFVVIDGKTYVEQINNSQTNVETVVTPGAGPQVHPAVKAPPTPVTSRNKKDKKVVTAAK